MVTKESNLARDRLSGALRASEAVHAANVSALNLATDEKSQRRLNIQYEIARVLAEVADLQEATQKVFKTICSHEGFVAASLWKVSGDSEFLQYVDFWTGEESSLVNFVAESLTLRIAPHTGLAGRAWASGRPVWIADIREVPDLPSPAIRAGLRSGMAFPIAIQGEVKGVMVFWSFVQRDEDAEMLNMFHAISNQIGQYMERQIQSAKVLRLSRVHAVLSGINTAIVRTNDRQQLFDEICCIAVNDGKFGIVWIGQLNAEALEISPVAWAGYDANALVGADTVEVAVDSPRGQSMIARAVRSMRPVVSNNLAAESSAGGNRRLEALRRGYRSLLVMPLRQDDDVIGTLSLFAMEADFFTPDEINLLTELSGNVSFALENISRKEALNYLAHRDVLTG